MEYLDCTIRDGGYYNNWDFSKEDVQLYMQTMNKLPIKTIEVGYRSLNATSYEGKYFFCPDFILKELKAWAPTKDLAIMLNEKDCTIEDLEILLNPCIGYIDIIRIAVAPNRFDSGVLLAKAINAKGFRVAFNLMYMSSLDNHTELFDKLDQLNGVVEYLNLVDSYGSVYPEDVKRIFTICKSKVNVKLGFHGHNNIELAFINSLVALESGAVALDGTICGMGRGAGNLKTELFLTHMASKKGLVLDFDSLSAVVSKWEELKSKYQWGTNLPYMVSGANSLPQKDVMDWVTTRFYSITSIIRALNNQSEGVQDNLKLPIFSPIEEVYESAVIIGGGANALEHAEAINTFIKGAKKMCIIHASSKYARAFASCNWPQFFCLVGNEGHRLESVFSEFSKYEPIGVLPPYPRKMGTYVPEALKNKAFELAKVDITDKYKDSHTALALQIAKELGVKNIHIAGYDGYTNQVISEKEKELIIENNYLFRESSKLFSLFESITPTKYDIPSIVSIYKYIS